MIEKFSELNYTIHISFLTGAKPLRKGAAGCWFGPESDPSVGKRRAVYYYNSRSAAGLFASAVGNGAQKVEPGSPYLVMKGGSRAQNIGWVKKCRKM